MMESLNQFANAYAGLLAVGGLVLAVGSAIAAVYFYYNPRQSQYRLSYKVFGQSFIGTGIRRIGNAFKRDVDRSFPIYIDLWNSGAEPISKDVLREPVTISLQSSAVSRGVEIISAEVVRESHSGLSGFRVEVSDASVQLSWTHFDPAMAARVRINTSEPVISDHIAVFGKGLRLVFKRIRNLSDIGGAPSTAKNVFVFGVPIAIVMVLGGPATRWLSLQSFSDVLSYLYFMGFFVFLIVLIVGAVLAGVGINASLEWAFNTNSPIEKIEGEPSLRFSSDEERRAYLEQRRADLEFIYETER